MNIPTKAGNYVMPDEVFGAYRQLYPRADMEFARMTIWLASNPAKRPARPDTALKFVNNWFRKVPRASGAEQRLHTFAALTGASNVIEIGRGSDRPTVRQDGAGLWGSEAVVDVEWREPARRQTDMGEHVEQVPARRIAFGG